MELTGIKTAAITVDNVTFTAIPNPARLYKRDTIKLAIIIFLPALAKAINFGNYCNQAQISEIKNYKWYTKSAFIFLY